MNQGNRPTTLRQRMEIWEQAQRGRSDAEIAAALQLSSVTVRKWWRRAQREGRAGLSAPLGRPPRGPLSTVPPETRQTLRQLRSDFPGRGPETLRYDLADALHFDGGISSKQPFTRHRSEDDHEANGSQRGDGLLGGARGRFQDQLLIADH